MEIDRKTYVGGSDIAKILGLSPWGGPVDCWLEKIHALDEDFREVGEPPRENAVLKRGKRLEGYILDLAVAEFGILGKNRNTRHHDKRVPYFSAEIDAETSGVSINNIEVKTVHPFKLREWGETDTDQIPLHYIAQAQWGLGVTDRERTVFLVLIGDDLRKYEVRRDDITITAMRERATEFWERYVLTRVRPPMSFDDEHAIQIVRRMYPGTNGKEERATEEDHHWRSVMQEAQSKADKYLNVVHGAKAHLLDRMGESALLRFEDGSALRRKLISVARYTVEAREQMDARFIKGKA